MGTNAAKKIFVAIAIAVLALIVVSAITLSQNEESPGEQHHFDFDSVDELEDFWLVSKFGSFQSAENLVEIEDGILTMSTNRSDGIPMLLSKPIDLPPSSVLTVKRRVRLTRNSTMFAGGFALFQTGETELVPAPTDGSWFTAIGDGIVLVEYSYDLVRKQKRPGKDVFRFLASDWEVNDNYKLVNPIYGEWVDEVLIYDTRINRITYKLGEETYHLNSYAVDKPGIRILMHPYGTGAGNLVEIDFVDIKVEDKSGRRQ